MSNTPGVLKLDIDSKCYAPTSGDRRRILVEVRRLVGRVSLGNVTGEGLGDGTAGQTGELAAEMRTLFRLLKRLEPHLRQCEGDGFRCACRLLALGLLAFDRNALDRRRANFICAVSVLYALAFIVFFGWVFETYLDDAIVSAKAGSTSGALASSLFVGVAGGAVVTMIQLVYNTVLAAASGLPIRVIGSHPFGWTLAPKLVNAKRRDLRRKELSIRMRTLSHNAAHGFAAGARDAKGYPCVVLLEELAGHEMSLVSQRGAALFERVDADGSQARVRNISCMAVESYKTSQQRNATAEAMGPSSASNHSAQGHSQDRMPVMVSSDGVPVAGRVVTCQTMPPENTLRATAAPRQSSTMMRGSDVIDVLSALADAGATAWVDGGWGVDALIGEATREHSDVDLVVMLDEIDLVRATLTAAGFVTLLRDWLPTALAVAADDGREVDLHAVTSDGEGGGYQLLPDGDRFHFPAPVTGRIDGRPVLCVDAETQVPCHLGYEPTEKDKRDMRVLREHTGVEIPPSLQ